MNSDLVLDFNFEPKHTYNVFLRKTISYWDNSIPEETISLMNIFNYKNNVDVSDETKQKLKELIEKLVRDAKTYDFFIVKNSLDVEHCYTIITGLCIYGTEKINKNINTISSIERLFEAIDMTTPSKEKRLQELMKKHNETKKKLEEIEISIKLLKSQ